MAFDLNKNDGSAPVDSSDKAKGASKFDLSKKETTAVAGTENPSKPKTWIIGLIGVLIIGGGIWYYSSTAKKADAIHHTSTEVVPLDPVVAVEAETQSKLQPDIVDTSVKALKTSPPQPVAENVVKDKNAASLNRKIPVSFRQGSFAFARVNKKIIKRIITYLSENPAALIHINGYASSEGSLTINQTISQKRADAFKKYLVSNHIAESRIIAMGKGIENPIASNDSNTGRRKNRRVEITLPSNQTQN